jgi:hypothetical protein
MISPQVVQASLNDNGFECVNHTDVFCNLQQLQNPCFSLVSKQLLATRRLDNARRTTLMAYNNQVTATTSATNKTHLRGTYVNTTLYTAV